MRARAHSQLHIAGINTQHKLGEVAKLANFLSMRAALEGSTAVLHTTDREGRILAVDEGARDLFEVIVSLVAIESLSANQSVDQLLGRVRQQLERWKFGDLSLPPSEKPDVGSGNPEGE